MLTKKQIKEIREHLDRAQNPLFLFDNDNDGLCSFLLLQRYLGRGKGFPVKTAPELTADYFRKVRELESDYIFILDQPEVSSEFVEKVKEVNIPIVWIDHHEIEKEKIPSYVNYYNPILNRKKSDEPVTALCYQIANRKQDQWIAVIGCISDYFLPDFYSIFKKDFPELSFDSKNPREIYYNSKIGDISMMMGFSLMDRTTNVINMMKFLMKAKSPYDILEENKKTSSMHEKSSELYNKYLKLINKAKEEVKDSDKIFFFRYSGDVGMSADLSNRLNYLFPEKIVVIIRMKEGRASLSIRGKNIRDKVVKVIEDIEGATGGGHEDAVGAQMSAEDIDRFEEALKKIV